MARMVRACSSAPKPAAPISTVYSLSLSSSRMPSRTSAKNALRTLSSRTPIVYVRPRMPRAAAWGRYSNSAMAARTRSCMPWLTP
ncbi:hypothetical protein SCYAM73S_05277 [Streptomyces cyaneofuscatus]